MQLLKADYVLDSLEKKFLSGIGEMEQMGISDMFEYATDFPKNENNYGFHNMASMPKATFPFHKATELSEFKDMVVKTRENALYFHTGNYETDLFLMTPKELGLKAITGLNNYIVDMQNSKKDLTSAIAHIERTIEKLDESLDGEPQEVVVPSEEAEDLPKVSTRYLRETFESVISNARSKFKEFGVTRISYAYVDFDGLFPDDNKLYSGTTPGNFPMPHATNVTYAGFTNSDLVHLAHASDMLYIETAVPFKKNKTLLGLPRDIREGIVGQYIQISKDLDGPAIFGANRRKEKVFFERMTRSIMAEMRVRQPDA